MKNVLLGVKSCYNKTKQQQPINTLSTDGIVTQQQTAVQSPFLIVTRCLMFISHMLPICVITGTVLHIVDH